jgi:hypothetical protein
MNHVHAAAQLLDDPVVRDGLADHWSRILRLGEGQVNEGHRFSGVLEELLARNPDYTH